MLRPEGARCEEPASPDADALDLLRRPAVPWGTARDDHRGDRRVQLQPAAARTVPGIRLRRRPRPARRPRDRGAHRRGDGRARRRLRGAGVPHRRRRRASGRPRLARPRLRGAGRRVLVPGPGPARLRRVAGPWCGAGDGAGRRDRLRRPPVPLLGGWRAPPGVDDRVPAVARSWRPGAAAGRARPGRRHGRLRSRGLRPGALADLAGVGRRRPRGPVAAGHGRAPTAARRPWGGGSEVTAVRSPRPARGRPHGFDDDQATRRLLRSRPPRAALAWAEAALGVTVTAARPLRGGSASAVHLLRVQRGSGAAERVVLRRYVRPELNQEEPDIAEREARALRFVADLDLGAGVATPRLLALDATGAHAGVPALLMSRLPGRVDWAPADADRWLERLARLLPAIHGGPLPPPGLIRPFAPYRQESYESPGWARWPSIWARAIERFHQPTPDGAGPAVFIHRDFHPGNVLWRRGSVTGVVDWASASIGPACVDVGHCRGNLFQYGLEDVVLGRPPGVDGVGEDAEGMLEGHADGDGSVEWRDGGCGHRSSCWGWGSRGAVSAAF